jgi:hypothetical protein
MTFLRPFAASLFILFALTFIACQEEEPASVEIFVVDQQERPIDKAKISFYLQPGNSIQEKIIYTNNLGMASWEFDFIATLSIYGAKDNYYGNSVRDTAEVTLVRGKTHQIKLILAPN